MYAGADLDFGDRDACVCVAGTFQHNEYEKDDGFTLRLTAHDDCVSVVADDAKIYGGAGDDAITAQLAYFYRNRNYTDYELNNYDYIYSRLDSRLWTSGNHIYGGDGDDELVLRGGAGRGVFLAGERDGADDLGTAMGGGGDDRITIRGDYGKAYGDEGADVLDIVGFGASAYGGDGDDSIDVHGDYAKVSGGDGNDVIVVSGNKADHVRGDEGDDSITESTSQ